MNVVTLKCQEPACGKAFTDERNRPGSLPKYCCHRCLVTAKAARKRARDRVSKATKEEHGCAAE
jgi:hypothetical protein